MQWGRWAGGGALYVIYCAVFVETVSSLLIENSAQPSFIFALHGKTHTQWARYLLVVMFKGNKMFLSYH